MMIMYGPGTLGGALEGMLDQCSLLEDFLCRLSDIEPVLHILYVSTLGEKTFTGHDFYGG